ncbi:MAG: glutamate racemase [Gammaproteobacteria bacterium]
MIHSDLPIGVFDSGVGGLTVLQALKQKLPNESFLYLGDTARLPYGTKSADTIIRYVLQAVSLLASRGIKYLVVACNTASSVGLPALERQFQDFSITGVIEPGAKAASANSKSGKIAVIATEATVNTQSYQQAILRIKPSAQVISKSCGLMVALAEEGWHEGSAAISIAQTYLQPFLYHEKKPLVDCLVLGCTHFPTLLPAIQQVTGHAITIIDSAKTTADVVFDALNENGLMQATTGSSSTKFLVTDAPERFTRVAKRFLNMEISDNDVEWVEL